MCVCGVWERKCERVRKCERECKCMYVCVYASVCVCVCVCARGMCEACVYSGGLQVCDG